MLLSGKQTGDYGVEEVPLLDGSHLRATGLARSLVNMAVRPIFGGGAQTVLSAYRTAVSRTKTAHGTLGTLVAEISMTLDALAHSYPYHQAVGFYLDREGAPDSATRPLRQRGLVFDFYLEYAMKGPQYDPSWRVYHPVALG